MALRADLRSIAGIPVAHRHPNRRPSQTRQTRQPGRSRQNRRPLVLHTGCLIVLSSQLAPLMCHSQADCDHHPVLTSDVSRYLPETLGNLLPLVILVILANTMTIGSLIHEILVSLVIAASHATFELRSLAKRDPKSTSGRIDLLIEQASIPDQMIVADRMLARANLLHGPQSGTSRLDRSHHHDGRSQDLALSGIVDPEEKRALLLECRGAQTVGCFVMPMSPPRLRPPQRHRSGHRKVHLTTRTSLAPLWTSMTDLK